MKIILYQEVRELFSLNINVYICCKLFVKKAFYKHRPIIYKLFLNRAVWTLEGATYLSHSGHGSNKNERVLYTP